MTKNSQMEQQTNMFNVMQNQLMLALVAQLLQNKNWL